MGNPYKLTRSSDGMGETFEVTGPGMPQFAKSVHFIQELNEFAKGAIAGHLRGAQEAETVARWLALAYLAGREAKAAEVRDVLGVRNGG
jgi:hypothetical protein